MPRPIDPARIARFIVAYKAKPNAREAALEAGYAPRSAAKIGSLLLDRPAVKAALANHAESEFLTIERQAGRVLAETARIAFADPAGLFDTERRLKPLPEMNGGIRLLRHGRLAALTLLARYLRLMASPAGALASEEGASDEGEFDEPAPPLNAPRKARFAAEYTVDFNATNAAIRAGYVAKWVQNRGYKLLLEPAVQAAIAARAQSRLARAAIAPERVLREIARIAFFDVRRLLHPDGTPRAIHEIESDVLATLTMIEVPQRGRGVRFRLRCLDKLVALRLLLEVLEARSQQRGPCKHGAF